MTLDQAIGLFLAEHAGLMARSTLDSYRLSLGYFAAFVGPEADITAINRHDLSRYREKLLLSETRPGNNGGGGGRPLARRTVHRYMREVKRLFSWLVDQNYLAATDLHKAKLPKLSRREPKAINKGDFKRLLRAAQVHREIGIGRLYAAVQALFSAGWTATPIQRLTAARAANIAAEAVQQWLSIRPHYGPLDDPEAPAFVYTQGEKIGEPLALDLLYYIRSRRPPEVDELHYWRVSARDAAALLFLADTGCRAGGLKSLTLDRLYLNERRAIVLEKGRAGGVHRPVFMSEKTTAALAAWLGRRPDVESDKVFLIDDRAGRWHNFGRYTLYHLLRRLAKQAAVKGRTNPHAFRHAAAREWLNNGANLVTVSRLLGHSSIGVTADFYALWDTNELAKAHEEASYV